MNAENRAILISAIDELRQEVRGSWVHWINITASSDLNPDEIVDILLTACDDGESSVQILECDNKFDSFAGPSFRMLPEWWDYLNQLATGGRGMKSGQDRIIDELTVIKNIKDILRDERPLTYKNSSALKGELHDMQRHVWRMEEWTKEPQEEET